jgi:hypothetical protein
VSARDIEKIECVWGPKEAEIAVLKVTAKQYGSGKWVLDLRNGLWLGTSWAHSPPDDWRE